MKTRFLVMEFLRQHQLNIMLILIGICGILAFFVSITKTLSKKRRQALFSLELGAMFLLIFDRFAYIYRGDISSTGYWMVRISNFFVFFLSLTILHAFNSYLVDLFRTEAGYKNCPVRLRICKVITVLGIASLIVSQFTDFYYYFDEQNRYVRGDGIFLSYAFPFLVLFLDFSIIIQYRKKFRKLISLPLIIFSIIPIVATIVQLFAYGVSLTNITCVGMAIILYIFSLIDLNVKVESVKQREIEILKEEQNKMRVLFEQTATALANAIDAKDEYTHGHSMRVAEYALQIAQESDKDEKYCSEVYFAGLLHDVGKIGVPSSIINKDGKLTDEEFAEIKKHPVIGKQILSSIDKSPYLSIAANYHHERYDGRGYPQGLKGDDIPEIARIIAVADAYDAMTSKRSYRDPIPQDKVREEIVKGMGYQFDPDFASKMLHLIDLDTEYNMKEKEQVPELAGKNELVCDENSSVYSEGLRITEEVTRFKMCCKVQDGFEPEDAQFTLVLFDSLDGRVHFNDAQTKETLFTEFAEISFDGTAIKKDARKIKVETTEADGNDIAATTTIDNSASFADAFKSGINFEGEAVKYLDHVLITLRCKYQTAKITVALMDNSRFAYLSLTGACCCFSNVEFIKTNETINKDYIPRIAEEVSYIDGPEGDIPNIQIDGWRSASSEAFLVSDGMTVSFHSKSLPTARLIWHCPFVTLFYADDKIPDGKNFMEFVCIRIDGENWEDNKVAENTITINKNESFDGWPAWKEMNKKGFDCTVHFHRHGNKITVTTENGGIAIKSVTIIKEEPPEVYAVLTGDQCVITNIKISR